MRSKVEHVRINSSRSWGGAGDGGMGGCVRGRGGWDVPSTCQVSTGLHDVVAVLREAHPKQDTLVERMAGSPQVPF